MTNRIGSLLLMLFKSNNVVKVSFGECGVCFQIIDKNRKIKLQRLVSITARRKHLTFSLNEYKKYSHDEDYNDCNRFSLNIP
jgi:hypothetical protein